MNFNISLAQRYALLAARYGTSSASLVSILSFALSIMIFLMSYLTHSSTIPFMGWLFLFIGIQSFERSGFCAILERKDAEIADLRNKLEKTA
jgi:hypothetical protein